MYGAYGFTNNKSNEELIERFKSGLSSYRWHILTLFSCGLLRKIYPDNEYVSPAAKLFQGGNLMFCGSLFRQMIWKGKKS